MCASQSHPFLPRTSHHKKEHFQNFSALHCASKFYNIIRALLRWAVRAGSCLGFIFMCFCVISFSCIRLVVQHQCQWLAETSERQKYHFLMAWIRGLEKYKAERLQQGAALGREQWPLHVHSGVRGDLHRDSGRSPGYLNIFLSLIIPSAWKTKFNLSRTRIENIRLFRGLWRTPN